MSWFSKISQSEKNTTAIPNNYSSQKTKSSTFSEKIKRLFSRNKTLNEASINTANQKLASNQKQAATHVFGINAKKSIYSPIETKSKPISSKDLKNKINNQIQFGIKKVKKDDTKIDPKIKKGNNTNSEREANLKNSVDELIAFVEKNQNKPQSTETDSLSVLKTKLLDGYKTALNQFVFRGDTEVPTQVQYLKKILDDIQL